MPVLPCLCRFMKEIQIYHILCDFLEQYMQEIQDSGQTKNNIKPRVFRLTEFIHMHTCMYFRIRLDTLPEYFGKTILSNVIWIWMRRRVTRQLIRINDVCLR